MIKETDNNVEASVVRFFIDAALNKETALSIIEESKGKLILQEKAILLFTLPDLFEVLSTDCAYKIESMAYLAFRKELYSSSINQQLKSQGLELSIDKGEKVDSTVYKLQKT